MKIYATRKFEFEACHYLPNYVGPCAKLHGHSYQLEVTLSRHLESTLGKQVSSPKDTSMVMDFKDIDNLVKMSVLNDFDHNHLNAFIEVPTAEALVVDIFKKIDFALKGYNFSDRKCKLEEVKLWETSNSYATYRGE